MWVRSLATAAAWVLAAPAWALPAVTVGWLQPTGTTNGTEVVEVWLRLTVTQLDAGPLMLDGTSASFSAQDFERLAQRGFARIDRISNSGSVLCGSGDTFFSQPPLRRCNDPAAAWSLQLNRGADSFFAAQAEPLAPGQTRDYLFATFTPKNGPVAPGIYSLSTASLHLSVSGTDVDGKVLAHSLPMGATCSAGAAECTFTRVVTAVPEPATQALMGLGLLAAVGAARRQGRQLTS